MHLVNSKVVSQMYSRCLKGNTFKTILGTHFNYLNVFCFNDGAGSKSDTRSLRKCTENIEKGKLFPQQSYGVIRSRQEHLARLYRHLRVEDNR